MLRWQVVFLKIWVSQILFHLFIYLFIFFFWGGGVSQSCCLVYGQCSTSLSLDFHFFLWCHLIVSICFLFSRCEAPIRLWCLVALEVLLQNSTGEVCFQPAEKTSALDISQSLKFTFCYPYEKCLKCLTMREKQILVRAVAIQKQNWG